MFIRDRLLSKSDLTDWYYKKFLGEDVLTILYIGPTDNKLPFQHQIPTGRKSSRSLISLKWVAVRWRCDYGGSKEKT
jgi:hypothetical protein